jgi:hypothetical protein
MVMKIKKLKWKRKASPKFELKGNSKGFEVWIGRNVVVHGKGYYLDVFAYKPKHDSDFFSGSYVCRSRLHAIFRAKKMIKTNKIFTSYILKR